MHKVAKIRRKIKEFFLKNAILKLDHQKNGVHHFDVNFSPQQSKYLH